MPARRVTSAAAAPDGGVTKSRTARDAGQSFVAVHAQLRAAILAGEIPERATTSQAALAEQFGVGRTPLREALRMLQREGLIISEPNHRLRIAELSGEDAEELYIMRISLETVAIRITVPVLTPTDLAELEGFMAQMAHYAKTRDSAGYRIPHRQFHHRLIYAAGSRVSTEIDELFDHSERYRQRFGALGSWQERAEEHRAILDAAAAGDRDGAAELLAAHYLHTVRLVFGALDSDHDLGRLRTAVAVVTPGAAAAHL
ncbi:MAG: GntR family transcriptional regulator [Solirubrobacterales bacterium]|nr:GntR family transcriptional regulator [Solirubrobacterales bacterium]